MKQQPPAAIIEARSIRAALCAWFVLATPALAFPTAEPPGVTVNLGEEVCVLIHPPDDVAGPKSIIKGLAKESGIKRREFQLPSFGL